MKLLITGGHPAPALAVLDYACTSPKYKSISFVFVGRQFNNSQEQSLSFEYQEITQRHIPFIHLETGRLTRVISFQSLKNLLLIPIGFLHAWNIVLQQKPDRILTFGGYIALPIAVAGWMQRIPVHLHEQTIHPGLATMLIGKIAKRIFISFPEAKQYLPSKKTILTGNTVRKAVFEERTVPLILPKGKPIIYVTGGSLGSHSINMHIEAILEPLLEKYTVIHQTGNVQEYNDFERLSTKRKTLPEALQKRYFVREHITADEIGFIYKNADLVIGRSGANTVFELIALQKPSILIPLPWSAHNEQLLQAKMMEKAGVSIVFEQHENSQKLLALISQMLAIQNIKQNFSNLAHLYNPNAEDMVLETVSQT